LVSTFFTLNLFLLLNLFSLRVSFAVYSILYILTFYLYIRLKKKPDHYKIIFRADRHYSLEERLITFWEYKDFNDSYGLINKLKEELEEKLSKIDLSKAYKFKPSKLLKGLLLFFVILLIFNLVYSFPKDISKVINLAHEKNKEQNQNLQKIVNNKGKMLENDLLNEKLQKEKASEDEFYKEKIGDLQKPKSLEEFLSQYNFDKNTLKNEKIKTASSNKTQEEKENSENKNKEEKGKENKEASIDSSNLPSLAGKNQASLAQSPKSSGAEREGEENLPKEDSNLSQNSPQERMLQNPIPGEGLPEKTKQTGSLPGTEERETKLGETESQRKVFSGEKIYVPPSLYGKRR